jgi:hypothetical protein
MWQVPRWHPVKYSTKQAKHETKNKQHATKMQKFKHLGISIEII